MHPPLLTHPITYNIYFDNHGDTPLITSEYNFPNPNPPLIHPFKRGQESHSQYATCIPFLYLRTLAPLIKKPGSHQAALGG
jgi:hypothetical protein